MKKLFFKRSNSTFLFTIVLVCGILVFNPVGNLFAYDVDNEFIPGAFPGKVKVRTFSIPVNPDKVMVVYPGSSESIAEDLRLKLARKCGHEIPFHNADELSESDFHGKHLIVIGNITNNRWALELYRKRCAFADAYFPGNSGVVIHPITSLWDPDCYVLVIGVSRDEDIQMGFDTFLSLIEDGARTIESIHHLKTSLNFPKAPEGVKRIFDSVRKDINVNRISYGLMPDWGLSYYLTGNKKWAEHFRDGMYFLYERGEKTGKWIPEPWTNVYFLFWKMVLVWDLLDEDPFFTIKDHRIIDEVLWGYFNFCRGKPIPLLDADRCLPGEMRQNHSTFMALSLFYAHRYFTGKYGISGLDDVAEKFRRCFDGQAQSYRPNDDAGGYLNYGVTHTLNYLMAQGDDSYLENGRLRDAASLTIAALDNRRDPVSLGDVGGYAHRRRDYPRGLEDRFLSMAAWYYRDSEFQWVYNWSTQDRSFRLESLYSGDYTVDIPEKHPETFLGIHPVILDETSLRWSARRSEKSSFMPLVGRRYIDKMAF
ncbi:MAG: hypothetical protein HOC71_13115, partial [Candidatus Latescibacteria bacterium]|nr:hypothetical protein [Candidatus Latescibacterota bacterium]